MVLENVEAIWCGFKMFDGEWFVNATVHWSFVIWFFGVREMVVHGVARARRFGRRLWFSGALLMLLHVLLSFHFIHGWSHANAVEVTAEQTREVAGFDWGGGVWINYLFTAIWLADATWWLMQSDSYAGRPKILTLVIHSFMAFIWLNATVVFGDRLQIAGLAAFAYLGARMLAGYLAKRNNWDIGQW